MELQFESLALEYLSPEARLSLRHSRVSLYSMRESERSTARSSGSESGNSEALLRFAPKPKTRP